MRRLLMMVFLLLAVVVGAIQSSTSVIAAGCGCPKTNPVCCRNCDGSFAYCARSFAFCPECAAP